MAELTAFSYRSGVSQLHRLDARFKLLFMVLISMGSLHGTPVSLFVTTLLVLVVLAGASVPMIAAARELTVFPLFLLFVFVARALATPGESLFDWMGIAPTREGTGIGLLVCWRLTLVLMISLGFVSTTKSSEIKAGVEWFLSKVPFIPEKRVSIMMSLLIRFIPVVFNQVRETMDAQRARGVENRKNPVYRLVKLTIPLMRRIFQSADRLAVAMESRCYSENRTDPQLITSPLDWGALLLVLFIFALLLFF